MKFLILLMLIMSAGCSADQGLPTAEIEVGQDTYTVEIARSEEEHQQGLMHRDSLGDYAGMLFVFERDRHLSFWMKNTYIPLSIAYISKAGVIKSIHDMQPESLRPVKSEVAVRFALELPQGAFARSGVQPGDKIEALERFLE
ncbi:MAG: DUF192 domain-containing protein [bacterium]